MEQPANKKLLIVQDTEAYRLHQTQMNCLDILQSAEALTNSYNIDECIIVIHDHAQEAQTYLNESCSIEFRKIATLIEDMQYKKFGVNGSIYIGLDYVDDNDTLILCFPSKCFSYSEDGLSIVSSELEILQGTMLMEYEELLSKSLARIRR